VLSLPDGVVSGYRHDLASIAENAQEAARQAAAASVARWLPKLRAASSSSSSTSSADDEDAAPRRVSSLNTVTERGVLPARQSGPEDEELERLVDAAAAACRSTAGGPTARSLSEVLALEAAAWAELDAVAALLLRVQGQRSSLPFGLLQLRPPPAPRAVQSFQARQQEQQQQQRYAESDGRSGPSPAAADGASSSSSGSSSDYAGVASDGLDVHASPLFPPLRRAARFSFALASVLDLHPGEGRQALLEHSTIAGRLKACVARLIRQRKVLAAMAAVNGLKDGGGGSGGRGGGGGKGGGGTGGEGGGGGPGGGRGST